MERAGGKERKRGGERMKDGDRVKLTFRLNEMEERREWKQEKVGTVDPH